MWRWSQRGRAPHDRGAGGRTGMTVRNIRAHQSRGLLPPPEIRGRTGYYGTEHVTRLELISEMQADGFNLQAIKRLIDVSDGSGEELLGFKRALMAPFEQEAPEFIEQAELNERWGVMDRKLLAQGAAPGPDPPDRRGPLRGSEPDALPRRRGAARAGRRAARRAGGRGAGRAPRARRSRRRSSSCSWRRSGSRSWRPGGPRRNGRRCARRSSGCARSPPRPCWPRSSAR